MLLSIFMNNFERCFATLAAAAALISPLCAQTEERRATFSGGGGSDTTKCTIEVYVDGSADVEIRGDRGILRTLTGQRAQWRRFVCSGPAPAANTSDFRFSGVDGRGRQELIQDPRTGRGVAIVRIQDTDGGAEGYTFDLEWRGGVPGSYPTGQPLGGGRDRWVNQDQAARACQDAVAERAERQYGFRNIDVRNLNADDNPGRNDTIIGSFDVRRGNYSDTYRFSCAMNLANGRVRAVDISLGDGARNSDRYDEGQASPCWRAAEQRIQRDGYRNVRFGGLNTDLRRNGKITGLATAQRGNNGRAYDFDIACTVNLNNGAVKSIQVKRR